VIKAFDMQLTEEQITSFQTLYKKAFNKEISRTEALKEALALIRFVGIVITPIIKNDDKQS
jgi:hypothetical protein